MINSPTAAAIAGALGGALLALGIVFGAVATGALPTATDARLRNYLLSHPRVLVEISNKLQEQQDATDDEGRQKAFEKLGLKPFFNPRLAFVTGPASARTTLVEFFDYNCPYCRASVPTVKHFLDEHKTDARVAFIEFPIKGPQSTVASRAAIAARQQPDKYLAFHFLLMGETELVTEEVVFADAQKAGLDVNKLRADMQDRSVDMAIAAAHNLAAAVKVDGTPAFIVNGRVHEGALDDSTLQRLLKTAA
jgi:protein-disulfide isomerase